MEADIFILKENNNSDTNQVEVYFTDAGFTPLYKSQLKENSFYLFNENFVIGNISDINIKVNISQNKKIRIWTSHSSIYEYLNFLYICHQCSNNEISVIFTDDYEKYLFSLGAANYKEIPAILKYEISLTDKDIERYNNEWLSLVKENSELRVFKNGQVINVNYDYLNKYLSKHYNDQEDITKIIVRLKGYDVENNLPFEIYEFLIKRLIENKEKNETK